ncbi:MAG: autorepressor SdpR family transcription factor [Lachnospiraceae bacterium]|nr:autorepressor SdpR family transcription factor [Lachnospiraceae bacterium]
MGFAETFKALADPGRRDILTMLRDRRMSAGEIGSHFDMTGATVSYHLNILKKAGLLFEEKEKNYIFYSLNTSIVEEVMVWLADLRGNTETGVSEGGNRDEKNKG